MTHYPRILLQKSYGPEKKADWWELADSAVVPHPVREYVIPKGYTTDLISGPWLSYPLIHPHGAGSNEAIPHDWEHEHGYLREELGSEHARQLSNLLMATRMVQNRLPLWKVWVMLLWTTAFSWIRWNNLEREENLKKL